VVIKGTLGGLFYFIYIYFFVVFYQVIEKELILELSQVNTFEGYGPANPRRFKAGESNTQILWE